MPRFQSAFSHLLTILDNTVFIPTPIANSSAWIMPITGYRVALWIMGATEDVFTGDFLSHATLLASLYLYYGVKSRRVKCRGVKSRRVKCRGVKSHFILVGSIIAHNLFVRQIKKTDISTKITITLYQRDLTLYNFVFNVKVTFELVI